MLRSQHIGFTNTTSTLEFTAFQRPDNKTAFVIMNTGDKADAFQVRPHCGALAFHVLDSLHFFFIPADVLSFSACGRQSRPAHGNAAALNPDPPVVVAKHGTCLFFYSSFSARAGPLCLT